MTAKILPDGRILGILRDITDRRRAEAELRQREERFRTLIENASDIITVMNHDGVIRYQSPSVERILGYQPEQLVGQSTFSYVHPEDVVKAREAIDHLIQQPGVLVTLTVRLKHRDGAWRIIEAIGRNIRFDQAEGQLVFNARDITQASKLEEQLRQSQKMEAIGQLSGGVAHDFNNILTVVQMHLAQFESHSTLPTELQESVLEIKQFIERASNLTRQLLAFSRRQTIQLRALDLNEVTSHMTKMLQRILGRRHPDADALFVASHPGVCRCRHDGAGAAQSGGQCARRDAERWPAGGRDVAGRNHRNAGGPIATGSSRHVCLFECE
ncbi:MAG: PAS domain S-box protein [Verrucomicrobiota bacterium]